MSKQSPKCITRPKTLKLFISCSLCQPNTLSIAICFLYKILCTFNILLSEVCKIKWTQSCWGQPLWKAAGCGGAHTTMSVCISPKAELETRTWVQRAYWGKLSKEARLRVGGNWRQKENQYDCVFLRPLLWKMKNIFQWISWETYRGLPRINRIEKWEVLTVQLISIVWRPPLQH